MTFHIEQKRIRDLTVLTRFRNPDSKTADAVCILKRSEDVNFMTAQLIKIDGRKEFWWRGDLCEFSHGQPQDQLAGDLLEMFEQKMTDRRVWDRIYFVEPDGTVRSFRLYFPEDYPDEGDKTQSRKTTISQFYSRNSKSFNSLRIADIIDEKFANSAVVESRGNSANGEWCQFLSHDIPKRDFFEVITQRRSRKKYSGNSIDISVLASILKYGAGCSASAVTPDKERIDFYTYPIGGGIKSTQVAFYANRVNDLDQGFFLYDPAKHAYSAMETIVEFDELANASAYKEAISNCSVLVFLVLDLFQKGQKYNDKAYRIGSSEAGHLSQNIHLCAQALDLKSCVLMGYDDELYGNALGLNNGLQSVFSILTIGT